MGDVPCRKREGGEEECIEGQGDGRVPGGACRDTVCPAVSCCHSCSMMRCHWVHITVSPGAWLHAYVTTVNPGAWLHAYVITVSPSW